MAAIHLAFLVRLVELAERLEHVVDVVRLAGAVQLRLEHVQHVLLFPEKG
jgi:hypothetical protein